MSPAVILTLCAALSTTQAYSSPPSVEQKDALFTFDGVAGLREQHCVPPDYQLPETVQQITAQCLSDVRGRHESRQSPSDSEEIRGVPDLFRSPGTSLQRFYLSIRDCMAEKMGYIDESGEFIPDKLEEALKALQFPEAFARDVHTASRACLHHMPADLSVEQRQNFYYVCRDSLLEVNCLYHRLEVEDPVRALNIGIQQTRCLDNIQPSENVLSAMDQCKELHDVPVEYASLRKRRSDEPAAVPESSGEAPPQEEEPAFVLEQEEEEKPSLAERVSLFVHCVHTTIHTLEGDKFNAKQLIEELKQFQGEEKHVKLQVDAATRCKNETKLEAFNMCYYDDISSGCHIFQVQKAFLAGDESLLPKYDDSSE